MFMGNRMELYPRKGGIMLDFIHDIWNFMRIRKKLWLLPVILVLLIFGILFVLTSGSALAPLIYTIF